MRLRNVDKAIVDEDKILNYLLNSQHPDGAPKAKFFEALGFKADEWQALAVALVDVARSFDIMTFVESEHGQKYIIEGVIRSPINREAKVRTVWIVESGQDGPRLVTAYPCE